MEEEKKITKLKFHAQYIKQNLGIHIIILLCFVLPSLLFIDYTKEYEIISSMKITEGIIEAKRKAGKLLKARKEINLIQYKYEINGEIITTADAVGIKKWNKLREGDKIVVEYNTKDPSKSRIKNSTILLDPFSYSFEEIFTPFIMTPLLFILGMYLLLKLKNDRTLLEVLIFKGKKAEGKIIKAELIKEKKESYYQTEYEFTNEENKIYTGKIKIPFLLKKELPKGKGIVLYDCENPLINIWGGENILNYLSINFRDMKKNFLNQKIKKNS